MNAENENGLEINNNIKKNSNSQNVVEGYVGSHIAVFRDEVDVFLAADTCVKPKD